ncbi:MAG: hypothetical protein AAF708_01350 [Deinococcota bacterium]
MSYMQPNDELINWLLAGDPAIRWQVMRDLQNCPSEQIEAERARVQHEGWGAQLLTHQDADGLWGGGLYSPKWTATTHCLLLLKYFGATPTPPVQRACQRLLDEGLYEDGGINYFPSLDHGETCVTGMVLALLAYFEMDDARILQLVDHLLTQQMADGGWNCWSFKGATHSSLHTTISVLEGLHSFTTNSTYKHAEIQQAQTRAHEFLLVHKLFRSDHTGEIIDARMTRLSFPPRWRYDVLRALDYLQMVQFPFDERLTDGLELLLRKRRKDGKWPLQQRHTGQTFFELEQVGKPSRWNTLRALRVLKFYQADFDNLSEKLS